MLQCVLQCVLQRVLQCVTYGYHIPTHDLYTPIDRVMQYVAVCVAVCVAAGVAVCYIWIPHTYTL